MNYVEALTTRQFVEYSNAKGIVVNASVMTEAGYFCVSIDPSAFWKDAHDYLTKKYGENNYTWTGEKFWFDTAKEAQEFYEYYRDWLED